MLTDQRLMMFPNQTPEPEYSIDKLLSEERPVAELLEKLSRILLRTQDVPQTLYGYMVPLCAKIFGKTYAYNLLFCSLGKESIPPANPYYTPCCQWLATFEDVPPRQGCYLLLFGTNGTASACGH